MLKAFDDINLKVSSIISVHFRRPLGHRKTEPQANEFKSASCQRLGPVEDRKSYLTYSSTDVFTNHRTRKGAIRRALKRCWLFQGPLDYVFPALAQMAIDLLFGHRAVKRTRVSRRVRID